MPSTIQIERENRVESSCTLLISNDLLFYCLLFSDCYILSFALSLYFGLLRYFTTINLLYFLIVYLSMFPYTLLREETSSYICFTLSVLFFPFRFLASPVLLVFLCHLLQSLISNSEQQSLRSNKNNNNHYNNSSNPRK